MYIYICMYPISSSVSFLLTTQVVSNVASVSFIKENISRECITMAIITRALLGSFSKGRLVSKFV
jgi:hypothetical protein